ncbi:peroxiredoxin [Candidatus Aquiluna sp. UB-MaderosW2red]|jgi:peroxiredoxin|uniref:peroxiredoxin n=1 Tax=Candidatus Aquiluna sp. UB-MaderosW2red TaxID=1855377 RepID=UPI000875C14A|nr:peroxiredoxin [Candidatus Aquiluna sp. UB-MaderosW2red]SCX10926.1 Peroxiredoxin [Candidatus Aquiluna sp. UB-MaderosW2red]
MSAFVGDQAPDFGLINQHGEEVVLSSFRGHKPVVLVFFPFAFSGTCSGELCELRDNISLFERPNVELLAISIDSKFVQSKFAKQEGYQFSVLADFWPHGQVAREYEVFLDKSGHASRATFVIDINGAVLAKFAVPVGEARKLSDYEKALELI